MVYIAHEMTPFSGKDVTVYSNCDEVRLTFNKGGKTYTYKKDKNRPECLLRYHFPRMSMILWWTRLFQELKNKMMSICLPRV